MSFFFPFLIFVLMFFQPALALPSDDEIFKKSIEFYQNKQYEKSSVLLVDLTQRNSSQPLYWFNLGTCTYMQGRFFDAQKYFAKVIQLRGKLTPAAKLYQAKALAQLGAFEKSAQILQEKSVWAQFPALLSTATNDLQELDENSQAEDQALESYRQNDFQKTESILKSRSLLSLDGRMLLALTEIKLQKPLAAMPLLVDLTKAEFLESEKKQTAYLLLQRIRSSDLSKFPYWLNVDVSGGYNTNAFADGRSVSSVPSSLIRGSISAGYHFLRDNNLSWKLTGLVAYDSPLDAPELKTLIQTLQAPILFRRENIFASLVPYWQSQAWNDISVSTKGGTSARVSWSDERLEYGVDLDMANTRSTSQSYGYLSGSAKSIKAYIGMWKPSGFLEFHLLSGFDGTQDVVYSDGSMLPMTQNFQGLGIKLLWKVSPRIALSSGLSWTQHRFLNSAQPANKVRNDTESAGSLKLQYLFMPRITYYALIEATANSSTLGDADVRDKNYQILIGTLGFSWDVF